MKNTLVGCNKFTSKNGNLCYLLHFEKPFQSKENCYGLCTCTEFVNSDIFNQAIDLIGCEVVIDYERNGSYYNAINIRKI